MRPQITVYLSEDTKSWLTNYAANLGIRESEVGRLLIEREKRIKWLETAIQQKDPEQ